mmetsp:Transcript_50614/g.147159  ORF Transcript_50614/g.147159 Transcript_50614/m.147159 type:complete len:214 (+) Transcript_50614:577-1218(+)
MSCPPTARSPRSRCARWSARITSCSSAGGTSTLRAAWTPSRRGKCGRRCTPASRSPTAGCASCCSRASVRRSTTLTAARGWLRTSARTITSSTTSSAGTSRPRSWAWKAARPAACASPPSTRRRSSAIGASPRRPTTSASSAPSTRAIPPARRSSSPITSCPGRIAWSRRTCMPSVAATNARTSPGIWSRSSALQQRRRSRSSTSSRPSLRPR